MGKSSGRVVLTRDENRCRRDQQPLISTAIIDRISHAIAEDHDQGPPIAQADTYTAIFDRGGLSITMPRQPAEIHQNELLSAPDSLRTISVRFKTKMIRQNEQALFKSDDAGRSWFVVGNTAQAALDSEGLLVEHCETRSDGVAVTWVISKAFPNSGAMEIECELDGLHYAGETGPGHHFADESGIARLRVERVTAVDSSGQSWPVPSEVKGQSLTLRVSERILAEAIFPLAIDPIISPEFGMDEPVAMGIPEDQSIPSVGSNGNEYLVVWADRRRLALPPSTEPSNYFTFGARVSADGQVLDPSGFLVSRLNGTDYQIASNGKDSLVAWNWGGHSLRGVRVSHSGEVLDSTALQISQPVTFGPSHRFSSEWGQIASNGTDYLVVWLPMGAMFTEPESFFQER